MTREPEETAGQAERTVQTPEPVPAPSLEERLDLLRAEVAGESDFRQPGIADSVQELHSAGLESVVFLSACDTAERARVFCGTGHTLQEAWDAALDELTGFVQERDYDAVWLKADVVTEVNTVELEELALYMAEAGEGMYRRGLAFDCGFETALLEAELNSAGLLDYTGGGPDLDALNGYLADAGRQTLPELPESLLTFTCDGWFSDEDGTVYPLHNSGEAYGRRVTDGVDREMALSVITGASGYLAGEVNSDGTFNYGYYAGTGRAIGSYNILRHAGTIWSVICQYTITRDEALLPVIDSTVDYLVERAVVYRTEDTAYVLEEKNNELKIGGNGIAVVALTNYMEEFDTDEYTELAVALGNGILEQLDLDTGTYYHVLEYPEYSRKEEFRTVYYDGECTFALVRLYGLTGDAKWLTAAQAAVDNFIRSGYEVYGDHWVAYSMNEITKYLPEEEYFAFGLLNAQENLEKIYYGRRESVTPLELLMSTYEMYTRILDEGHEVAYLESFDDEFFLETIRHRAEYMLNGIAFPEYAMYFQDPAGCLGAAFIRQDSFRMRIDDVQHFIGGYYFYYNMYDRLMAEG